MQDACRFGAGPAEGPGEAAGARAASEAAARALDAARERVELLAEDHAALQRVATLVARGAPRDRVYAAVAAEIAERLRADVVALLRFDAATFATITGGWGAGTIRVPVGERLTVGGTGVAISVLRTGRTAFVEHLAGPPGSVAAWLLGLGVRSGIGSPVIVEGKLWGVAIAASTRPEALPEGSEARIGEFTELMGAAVASAEARAELRCVADEQAALHRVATLVAEAAEPSVVLAAVAEEVGRLLSVDRSLVLRYGPEDRLTQVAVWRAHGASGPVDEPVAILGHDELPVTQKLGDRDAATIVRSTGRPARVERVAWGDTSRVTQTGLGAGAGSVVGVPLVVGGRVWGALQVFTLTGQAPLPAGTEERLTAFAELASTAVANAQAREDLRRVADEQAALRRVATLVAHAAAPRVVFAAVAEEAGLLLSCESAAVVRYDRGHMVTVVAGWSASTRDPVLDLLPDGTVGKLVRETGHPVRIEAPEGRTDAPRRAALGVPITVDGALWGFVAAFSSSDHPAPTGAELRLAAFTELAATAIANAESQAEVKASRARIVAGADETRRRIVRDLHDGAQQRLVHTIITLKLARRALESAQPDAGWRYVGEALGHAEQANCALRELAHGILPSVLARGGLAAGVDELVSRMPVPVGIDVAPSRFPPEIEANAYFVIAEALTNVAKHSGAIHAEVAARPDDHVLRVSVHDDGVGGARPQGSGLLGLRDRVVALGGQLAIDSPPGGGTCVEAEFPLS